MSGQIEELPEPTDEPQTIDYFRISIQVGQLKGNKPVKVNWCSDIDLVELSDSGVPLLTSDEKSSKFKIKSSRSSAPVQGGPTLSSSSSTSQRNFSNQRVASIRPTRQTAQLDHPQNASNVNLGMQAILFLSAMINSID